MLLTDEQIIKRLKIKPTDKVLDIGGSMMQHKLISVDTLVDQIKPEEAPYGPTKLLAKNFVRADITRDRLPFSDGQFDVCLCTHTLEDLPTPFLIMDEMSRVAKRGLIITPSMGYDMVFTAIDYTDWLTGARRVPGEAHHKWFFVNDAGNLRVIPKNYAILYTKDFQVTGWSGEKEMEYYWKGEVKYAEFPGFNIHNLIDEYKKFLDRRRSKIKLGTAIVFVDSPYKAVRAWLKVLFKKGAGYKYRDEKIR